ncbi:MAG: membrane protein insertase YidC [Candidatus Korobacteraceae bacterium]
MAEYYNPQQEPGSERRLLIVFAITFLVLMVFQPLLTRYLRPAQPAEQQKSAKESASPGLPAAQAPSTAGPTSSVPDSNAGMPSATAATRQAEAEAETIVENDLYRVVFSNRGGQVKSWVLKHHQDDQGQPLDLVHSAAAEQYGRPLSLWTYDEALRNQLNSALYVASASGTQQAPAEINFEYAAGGLEVRKTFRFDHSYVIEVETSVVRNGQYVRAFPAWPAGFGDQHSPAAYASSRLEWQFGETVERLEPGVVSGGNTLPGPFQWVGVVDQYFAAVFLPQNPSVVNAVTLRHALEVPQNPNDPNSKKSRVEVLGLAVGSTSGATHLKLFVGPKALDVLQSIPVAPVAGQAGPQDLSKVLDFGKWLGWIAYPLFLWLRWTFHNIVSNWGWAIVVLTFVINIVLFPLRLSSMKSAMKMQKLQPQMNAIKEKYKKYSMKDPRRAEMNQEMAALFKREGANPAGGCLPLMLQMPFLIAFYSMLANANELRNASFLWIRDLSSPDPYYIIPILIVASTYAMQKMTPQAGMDPAQQKVMSVMMPLMLGVISWTLSAGLGVYWILGNLMGIAQQQILNRTSFGQEMRALAAKRARKE